MRACAKYASASDLAARENMGDVGDAAARAVSALKGEGNKYLKEGQHDEAISCYMRALEAMGPMSETASRAQDEERAVLYSNCALARLQRGAKGDAQAAWADARRAVELAPSYAKAHYRMGKALEAMGRGAEAAVAISKSQSLFVAGQTGRVAPLQSEQRSSSAGSAERAVNMVPKSTAMSMPATAATGESENTSTATAAAPRQKSSPELEPEPESEPEPELEPELISGPQGGLTSANLSADDADRPSLPPPGTEEFTAASLEPFNGVDGKPIYIALGPNVYDVTTGVDFYGPGAGYHKFAGKDASRAMAKMSFDPADINRWDTEDLTESQVKTLADWITKYEQKYPIVGTVALANAYGVQHASAGHVAEHKERQRKKAARASAQVQQDSGNAGRSEQQTEIDEEDGCVIQ